MEFTVHTYVNLTTAVIQTISAFNYLQSATEYYSVNLKSMGIRNYFVKYFDVTGQNFAFVKHFRSERNTMEQYINILYTSRTPVTK
jgi:hypothetical protein